MQPLDINLYLVGFMGTGKSTLSRALATRLGFRCLDSDHEIERQQQRPITEIFASEGEAYFRKLEREFIEKGHPDRGCVVACGGGLIVPPGMLDLLKTKGVVMCLHASVETILKRTQGNRSRPLLNVEDPEARIRQLYSLREPLYRQAGSIILTDGRSMPEVLGHILRAYKREAHEFIHPRAKTQRY